MGAAERPDDDSALPLAFCTSILCRARVQPQPCAGGPIRYSITDLGTLGVDLSVATGINNSGQVVGATQLRRADSAAFLWESGSGMQDLGTLGGVYSYAFGINDSGQVVGESMRRTMPSSGRVGAACRTWVRCEVSGSVRRVW